MISKNNTLILKRTKITTKNLITEPTLICTQYDIIMLACLVRIMVQNVASDLKKKINKCYYNKYYVTHAPKT